MEAKQEKVYFISGSSRKGNTVTYNVYEVSRTDAERLSVMYQTLSGTEAKCNVDKETKKIEYGLTLLRSEAVTLPERPTEMVILRGRYISALMHNSGSINPTGFFKADGEKYAVGDIVRKDSVELKPSKETTVLFGW